MTETNKRFRVTIGNENDVRFVDYVENRHLITISFKEYKDAVDCRDALLYQCNMMNELAEENQQLRFQLEECRNNKLFSRRELERENKELKKENDILIKQRLGEERLKQEIADYHTSNGKLHRLNNELIRRLDEFNINYFDILREFE